MKVVCVDDRPVSVFGESYSISTPNGMLAHGETYTVVGSGVLNGHLGYDIEGKPLFARGFPWKWAASRFVPLEYFQAEFCVKEETTEPATA